jgi:hypothetical protein
MTDVFDLGALVYGDAAQLAIRTRDGAPTGWKVTVCGPGHPNHADIQRRLSAFRDARARQEAMAKKRNDIFVPSAEEDAELWRDLFARRVLAWTPVKFDGADFPCDEANRRAIFAEPRFAWIAEQINEFASDLANFTRKTAAA